MKDKNEIRNILNILNYKELQRIWNEYKQLAYYYIFNNAEFDHISITQLSEYIYNTEKHFNNYELQEYFNNCDNEQDDNEEDF